MSKVVEVSKLTKIFKLDAGYSIKALDSVDMYVARGEVLGIVGKSGSGKTTLLRIIRGVETFDEGIVKVDDVTLTPNSTKEDFYKVNLKTAIHLQRSFGLWPDTVLKNVIYALYYAKHGIEDLPPEGSYEFKELSEQALEILRMVELDHRANLWAEVLSGGEKQRLILARQIARKPAVVLLDEPATMTCLKTREGVLKAIKMVNESLGIAFIVASHMPEVHEKVSQRLVMLNNGKVEDEGDVDKILKKFTSLIPSQEKKRKIIGKQHVIYLKNVTKKFTLIPYGEVFTLKKLTFNIHKSEVVGIIGPSGSGKTVLLRLMSGLMVPDEGGVFIKTGRKWVDITKLGKESMKARQKLGILHQEFSLPYWTKISDFLASKLGLKSWESLSRILKRASKLGVSDKTVDLISRIAELPENEMKEKLESLGLSPNVIQEIFKAMPINILKKRIKRILEELELPKDVLSRRAYELSAGEQIRVAIASLLISKPKLILLDEPFGDLDPITMRKVSNLIKRVNKKLGVTVALVDHQLGPVEETVNRVALIKDGVLVFDGEPENLVEKFNSLLQDQDFELSKPA
ncbi:MAG: ATP-binding cassette domain-containing protein [Candidatus Bathyarchaeota archaeon]